MKEAFLQAVNESKRAQYDRYYPQVGHITLLASRRSSLFQSGRRDDLNDLVSEIDSMVSNMPIGVTNVIFTSGKDKDRLVFCVVEVVAYYPCRRCRHRRHHCRRRRHVVVVAGCVVVLVICVFVIVCVRAG